MANNQGEGGLGDDFFEHMLSVPTAYTPSTGTATQHESGFIGAGVGGSASGADHDHDHRHGSMVLGLGMGHGLNLGTVGGFRGMGLPLGLNLDPVTANSTPGFLKTGDACNASSSSSSSRLNEGDPVHLTNMFPAFAQMQSPLRPSPPSIQVYQYMQPFQGQPVPSPAAAVPHPPAIRPRVRARRGQATDPHSIAERLRRERIAERLKALQELVPSCNKTDRAVMLDEIVDYVKFLRLQVKVLSMSRMGAAGAVAQLVADVPPSSVEGEGMGGCQPAWEKWSNDGTEQQVAKLLEEDIGAAMQFLQSKALCIMPISLASAIFRTHPPDSSTIVKPESGNPS
ncbi:hypothetical protein Ancab_024017 [Ancistrocladus abbreviatus]